MAFSSAGLTPFGHDLKPDVAAPGGAILSSTLKETIGEPFAVFDGTSMAAPHVSGAAALLLERHPNWSAAQVKSALMSTAGPAWGDTARTTEASVLLEGAGLIDVGLADAPLVFTDPQSLSFHYLNVNHGPASRPLLATISDAGNGYGTWQVELQPQSATSGAMLDLPAQVTLTAGRRHAAHCRRAGVGRRRRRRRLRLHRPAQGRHDAPDPVRVHGRAARTRVGPARKARERSSPANTRSGGDRASVYRWPTAPFGPAASYTGPPSTRTAPSSSTSPTSVSRRSTSASPSSRQSANSLIDPWFLGSHDENDVTGYPGTPVNVNGYLYDYRADVQAAGLQYPLQGQYFVAVDSGHSEFTDRSFAGRYLLHYWINDVKPPLAIMTTTTIAAGRPTIVARTLDLQAGVDPLSLVIAYGRVLIGAAAYDPVSGFAIFPLPACGPAAEGRQDADRLRLGRLPGGQERRPGGRHRARSFRTRRSAPQSLKVVAAADRAPGSLRSGGPASLPRGHGCWSSRARRAGRSPASRSSSTASRSRPAGRRDAGLYSRDLAHDRARGRAARAARGGHRCRRRAGGRQSRRQSVQEALAMDERVAVITGGSSGIGADARARADPRGLALRARRARRGAAARARRGDRRRGGDLRRRRPGGGRALAARVTEQPPADQAARQQRGHPRRGRTSSPATPERIENVIADQLPRRRLVPAGVPAGARGSRAVGRRQRRLGRRHGGDAAVGAVRGVEARPARVLARDGGAAARRAASASTRSSPASPRPRASRSAA